jgi:quercetin dioxygenase-like cupin family protein
VDIKSSNWGGSVVTENQEKTKTRYVYNFDELDRAPEGPCSAAVAPRWLISGSKTLATSKATSTGAVITGEHFHVALVWKPRGTGSKIHTHPNEQFNYVLQGTLIADIDGQVLLVPKGHVIHIPAGMPHSHVSTAEEDVWFFAAKDTRHGITGSAVDGKHDGPRYLPGFYQPDFGVPGINQWEVDSEGLPAPQTQNCTGRKARYVYNIHELDVVPGQDCSAKVTPRGEVRGKFCSLGSLTGQELRIELVRMARGSRSNPHAQPYEQFDWVLRGRLLGEVDGQQVEVPERSVLHLPEGVMHTVAAPQDDDLSLYVVKPAGT